ncbi:MAG TPA: 2Fe-2S iron-sulfur cluster-binding protein [Saprospiraceae bacterium]|nr:2Fe-2S iron-sulfur cluster-binding protein [Saprospiraceae bacterium]
MAKITFLISDGQKIELEGHSGSLMQLAVKNKVPGIDGDCGGVCSCATCHVQVDPAFMGKTGTPSEIEKYTLEFEDNLTEYSRLACQIQISEELDGISLRVDL